ncbi:unnamed protein product [Rhizoctonia solani]|uniref:Hemerythrin-like domain-containing protein n=1 Tax=Rhizoctonia solani TaxID=456999 RepID=A0A8H3H0N7_9AGAM|nr:unnamed protein product [Rhizoctonia solani]
MAAVSYPYPLIPTPPGDWQKNLHEMHAIRMAALHNIIIRSFNAIIYHAPNVTESDVPSFIKFCRAVADVVHEHHQTEEEVIFPCFEEKLGKGAMDANVNQHHDFMPQFDEWNEHCKKILSKEETYEHTKFVAMLRKSTDLLSAHLVDEIPTLEASIIKEHFTDAELRELEVRVAKKIQECISVWIMPILFVCGDLSYNSWFPDEPQIEESSRLMPTGIEPVLNNSINSAKRWLTARLYRRLSSTHLPTFTTTPALADQSAAESHVRHSDDRPYPCEEEDLRREAMLRTNGLAFNQQVSPLHSHFLARTSTLASIQSHPIPYSLALIHLLIRFFTFHGTFVLELDNLTTASGSVASVQLSVSIPTELFHFVYIIGSRGQFGPTCSMSRVAGDVELRETGSSAPSQALSHSKQDIPYVRPTLFTYNTAGMLLVSGGEEGFYTGPITQSIPSSSFSIYGSSQ